MNIGIILAAGKSTRFHNNLPKQLYPLNNKPIINHSIDVMDKILDEVIIITNTHCQNKIVTDKKILINDTDNRIESIRAAIDYLEGTNWDNILIHDAARPFITHSHVTELVNSQKDNLHSQYYLPIVDGLAKRGENGLWEIAKREEHINLCSPQITNFDLFTNIFREFIQPNIECEILPIVSKMNLKFNLIEGDYKSLRKITTINDL